MKTRIPFDLALWRKLIGEGKNPECEYRDGFAPRFFGITKSEVLPVFTIFNNETFSHQDNGKYHPEMEGHSLDLFLIVDAPEPTLVPWDCPEDVPMGAEFRAGQRHSRYPYICVDTEGVWFEFGLELSVTVIGWDALFKAYTYTLDGKTWHPCGKEKK